MTKEELIRSRVSYDPITGEFIDLYYNKPKRPRIHNGYKTLGFSVGRGKVIKILAHRVAWFLVHGTWPPCLDHKDGNKLNNKLDNLRIANPYQNAQNKRRPNPFSRLPKCVFWDPSGKRRARYLVKIKANGKHYNLGRYKTPEEAKIVAEAGILRLHAEFANID